MSESIKLQSIKEIFKNDLQMEVVSNVDSNCNAQLGSEYKMWTSVALFSQHISKFNSEYEIETKRNEIKHREVASLSRETTRKEVTPDDSISKIDHNESWEDIELIEENMASFSDVNCESLKAEIEINDSTNSKEWSYKESYNQTDACSKLGRNSIDSDLEAINLEIHKYEENSGWFIPLMKTIFPVLKDDFYTGERWNRNADRDAFKILNKEISKTKMDLHRFLFDDSSEIIDQESNKILCETRLSIINKIMLKYKWSKSAYLLYKRFRKLAENQSFSNRELRLLKSKASKMWKKGKFNIDSLSWFFPGKYNKTIKYELIRSWNVDPNKLI